MTKAFINMNDKKISKIQKDSLKYQKFKKKVKK